MVMVKAILGCDRFHWLVGQPPRRAVGSFQGDYGVLRCPGVLPRTVQRDAEALEARTTEEKADDSDAAAPRNSEGIDSEFPAGANFRASRIRSRRDSRSLTDPAAG